MVTTAVQKNIINLTQREIEIDKLTELSKLTF